MIDDIGIKFDEESGCYHMIFAKFYQPFESFPIDNYYFVSNALYHATKVLIGSGAVCRYKGNFKRLAIATTAAHCVGKNTLSYGRNGSRVVYEAIEVARGELDRVLQLLREHNLVAAERIDEIARQAECGSLNIASDIHADKSQGSSCNAAHADKLQESSCCNDPLLEDKSITTTTAPLSPLCVRCNMCADACPTHAIGANFSAEKCLRSYMDKGEFTEEIGLLMGDKILGCDICQRVCPMNSTVKSIAPPKNYRELMDGLPSNVKQWAPLIGKNLARDKVLGVMARNAARNRVNS